MSDRYSKTYAELTAEYRQRYPLFGAYWSITLEHNERGPVPITEPTEGGLTTDQVAALALQRVALTDELIVQMAMAYVDRLQDEIRSMRSDRPEVTDLVIDAFFTVMGCVPTPEEWTEFGDADQADWLGDINALLAQWDYRPMQAEMVPEALRLIIASDAERIAKAVAS